MKVFNIFLVVFLLLFACKADKSGGELNENRDFAMQYASFGDSISAEGSLEGKDVLDFLKALSPADSTPGKIKARVKDVCKAKGCWMTLELPGNVDARVVFKDYGFFVPKDIEGDTVIIEGLAFSELSTVEDQQHYARDAGLDEAAIDSITEAIPVYGFEARGVLIKK